jgi:hypothetical protein
MFAISTVVWGQTGGFYRHYAPGKYHFRDIDDLSDCHVMNKWAEVSAALQGHRYIAHGKISDGGPGLYGGGTGIGLAKDGCRNIPPVDLVNELTAAAAQIQRLDTNGNPSPSGSTLAVFYGYSISQHYACKTLLNTGANWTPPANCDSNSVIGQLRAKLAPGVTLIEGAGFGTPLFNYDTLSGWCLGLNKNCYDDVSTQMLTPLGFSNAQVQFVVLDPEEFGNAASPGLVNTDTAHIKAEFQFSDPDSVAWLNAAEAADQLRIMWMEYKNAKLVGLVDHYYGGWGTASDPRSKAALNVSPEPYMQMLTYAIREVTLSQLNQYRSSVGTGSKGGGTITTSRSGATVTVKYSGTLPAQFVKGAFAQVSGNSDQTTNTPCTSWGTAAVDASGTSLTWASASAGLSLVAPGKFNTQWPAGTIIHAGNKSTDTGFGRTRGADTITSVTDTNHLTMKGALIATDRNTTVNWVVSGCPGVRILNVTANSFQFNLAGSGTGGNGGIASIIPDNNVGGLDQNTAPPSFWLANIEKSPNPTNGDSFCSLAQGPYTQGKAGVNAPAGNHPTTDPGGAVAPAKSDAVCAGNPCGTSCQTIYQAPPQWQSNHNYSVGNEILDNLATTSRVHVQKVIACTGSCTSQNGAPPTFNESGGQTQDNQVTWGDQGIWLLADAPGAYGTGSGQEWEAHFVVQNLSGCVSDPGNFIDMPFLYSWMFGGKTC